MTKIIDSIIGHAVGDAMGVPTEFCLREHLLKKPITEMVSSNKTGQPAGSWSDDTSMEICTISSFIEKKKFDYSDIMTKWTQWINEAKYTANNDTFDVGRTCLHAIRKFSQGEEPLKCGMNSEKANGNGSLMRILPVALYSYYKNLTEQEIILLTNEMSSLTHSHNVSKLGCYIYVRYIMLLLDGYDKKDAYELIKTIDYSSYGNDAIVKYNRILKEDISKYDINAILSTGYVVDTLECAFWILLKSNSYKECIIASTNIGNDTDTIGAIVGSMAGIIYGYNSIPTNWLNKLKRKEYLIELANNFDKTLNKYYKDPVLGAIIGDIVGSRFEINSNKKLKYFKFFSKYCRFTDDTTMSLAVANAIMECNGNYDELENITIKNMVELGNKHIRCGFGHSFMNWLKSETHEPYNSYGNGSAMRISACGIFSNTKEEVIKNSKKITEISHNHPDGIMGAESVAMMIYLIKNGYSKEYLKEIFIKDYYEIDFTVSKLQKTYKGEIACSKTVPQAFQCFYESTDFEDAIRNAISIGGDSDTIAAICGSMAGIYYGIPSYMKDSCKNYLTDDLLKIYENYSLKLNTIKVKENFDEEENI